MGVVESCRLDWQRDFFLPVCPAVVCDGEEETGCRAGHFLVAEPDGFTGAAGLLVVLQARLRLYFFIRVQLDTVRPEPDHPLSSRGGAFELPGLRNALPAELQFLFRVRRTADAESEGFKPVKDLIQITDVQDSLPTGHPWIISSWELELERDGLQRPGCIC